MLKASLSVAARRWDYRAPFAIAGFTRAHSDIVDVTIEAEGALGRGEAVGVRYLGETADSIVAQLDALRAEIARGVDRASLLSRMRAGGARNALDCALWDLEAKLAGRPVWQLAGIEAPRPLLTVFTCGVDMPDAMAMQARAYRQARAIKVKLAGEARDSDRIAAVRAARPDVALSVDANQGYTSVAALRALVPALVAAEVEALEQPVPVGEDDLLLGLDLPLPVIADESVRDFDDLARRLPRRYQGINIKLDKCGGLTRGLALARAARAEGLIVTVGNMVGTSLAMAPAFLLGQGCDYVDLDGPLFLREDRVNRVTYEDGMIFSDEQVWGGP